MGFEQLVWWLESQSSVMIAIITLIAAYACAAVIFALFCIFARMPYGLELKSTTPVMLTPLAVITGLLIAFVASRDWSNVDQANTFVREEAGAIEQALMLVENLSSEVRTEVRTHIRRYLQFATQEEWPDMMQGRSKVQISPPGLGNALSAVLGFSPSNPSQQIAQQRTVLAIERGAEMSRNRIILSAASVLPIQWIAILVVTVLMLLTVAVVHIDRPIAMALNLFSLSTAIAVCFILLLVNDRPFSFGGLSVLPDPLTNISVE